ncbi:MAG: YdcF family protein [Alphaproteobacteria bacterium]|nr:YdcF family protein [Alphaproteobacteria bacterium]OJV12118.1 MAG: hypothetical protein BGO27_05200 [Alphaproteobacteria bacterium 33-17]
MKLSHVRIKILILFLQVLSVAFIIGFFVFVRNIDEISHEKFSYKGFDCIIVFTGGKGRIDAGLDIHKKYKSEKMLISGVWEGTSLSDIKKINDIKSKHVNVHMGYFATKTIENAVESDFWASFQGCKNNLIITSDYHVPRSNYLMKIKAKSMKYKMKGINAENFKIAKWWDFPGTFKLIFTEYLKYIITVCMVNLGFTELL